MSKRDCQRLQSYVNKIKAMLGLSEWEVVVNQEPCQEGNVASISWLWGRKYATLNVAKTFVTEAPRGYIRSTVIHELFHCVHAVPQDQIDKVLKGVTKKDTHQTFRHAWWQAHEYAIDGLAEAIAPLFPLPAFGGEDE